MAARDGKSPTALGFLTVVEHEPHGMFGGYLLLNLSGRPLEFHCTAPVKPNRAQQILFGTALEPYLYGEQIGQALAAKGHHKPLLICTDLAPALALREHVSIPVALVLSAAPDTAGASAAEAGVTHRLDAAHAPLDMFELGRSRLALAAKHRDDRAVVESSLASVADHFDLSEPFQRIRGAIEEAQRGGR